MNIGDIVFMTELSSYKNQKGTIQKIDEEGVGATIKLESGLTIKTPIELFEVKNT